MKYRRYFEPGGTYFFTLVTYNRQKILKDEKNINIFIHGHHIIQQKKPFEMITFCILPDHVHMLWKLPDNDDDYPGRIRLLKSYFSKHYTGHESLKSASRIKKNERTIWQRRYWEHFIRSEKDLKHHTEYIFYNPVKHGYANSPSEWKYGNFMRYVKSGLYEKDWGSGIKLGYFKNIEVYD